MSDAIQDLEQIVQRAVERALTKALSTKERSSVKRGPVDPGERDLIDTHAVITKTGLSRTTIARLVEAGTFPTPIKLNTAKSGRVLYERSAVEAWVDLRKQQNERAREARKQSKAA